MDEPRGPARHPAAAHLQSATEPHHPWPSSTSRHPRQEGPQSWLTSPEYASNRVSRWTGGGSGGAGPGSQDAARAVDRGRVAAARMRGRPRGRTHQPAKDDPRGEPRRQPPLARSAMKIVATQHSWTQSGGRHRYRQVGIRNLDQDRSFCQQSGEEESGSGGGISWRISTVTI